MNSTRAGPDAAPGRSSGAAREAGPGQTASDIRQILDAKMAECVPLLERMIEAKNKSKLQGTWDDPSRVNDAEKTIAQYLSSIPSIRSVVVLGQKQDEWRMRIVHDDNDSENALDQIVDRIMEAEDATSVSMMNTDLVHVSESESELPEGAKTILQR